MAKRISLKRQSRSSKVNLSRNTSSKPVGLSPPKHKQNFTLKAIIGSVFNGGIAELAEAINFITSNGEYFMTSDNQEFSVRG